MPCLPCGPRRGTSFAPLLPPVAEIGLIEVTEGSRPSVAEAEPSAVETLQYLISADGDEALEALRYARRSLLREERTRGRDPDEPSLEDAVFSPTQIVWTVGTGQRSTALTKLEEVRRRANLLLLELEGDPQATRASAGFPAV
jgi:hypothetical protein